jgi:hypothetical protein
MLRIQPQNGTVFIQWPIWSDVNPEKFWAVLEVVAFAPRVVNDLPVAEYPKYAFARAPNALALPDKLVIVPVFAARYTS